MVRAHPLLWLLLCLPVLAWAEEAEAPSLELLEFLAEGSEVDGLWLDPVMMNELTRGSNTAAGEESQSDE